MGKGRFKLISFIRYNVLLICLSAVLPITIFLFSPVVCLGIENNDADNVQFLRFFPAWTAGVLEVKRLERHSDVLDILCSLLAGNSQSGNKCAISIKTSKQDGELSRQFDKLIRRNLGISGNRFLRDIIGYHFVLGWAGPAMPEQFGLICRVKDYSALANLLTSAGARPVKIPTTSTSIATNQSTKPVAVAVREYSLKAKNIRAAVLGKTLLILATVGKKNEASMFDAMTDIAKGTLKHTLTDRKDVSSMLAKLKPDYDFLMFLTRVNADSKAEKKANRRLLLQRIISSLKYFAVASYHRGDIIELKVLSALSEYDNSVFLTDTINFNAQLNSMLRIPSDFVYVASINPLQWYHKMISLSQSGHPEAKQYRQLIELLIPNEQLRESFFESLGPEFLILIGSYDRTNIFVPPGILSSQTSTMPSAPRVELPDITIAIKTSNPTIATDTMEQIFRFLADFISVRNVMDGKPIEHITQKHIYNGFVIHTLNVADVSGKRASGLVDKLCWCLADEYLLVSTRLETIYELIDRTFEPERFPDIDDEMEFDEDANWCLLFKPASLSKRIDDIIAKFGEFQQNFNFSVHHQTKIILGIGTKVAKNPETGEPILKVAAVLPGYPAWGKLKIDDVIVAVNSEKIDRIISAAELSSKIAKALKHSRTIRFTVIRGKVLKTVTITVPQMILHSRQTRAIMLLKKLLNRASLYVNKVMISSRETETGEIEISIEAAKIKRQSR